MIAIWIEPHERQDAIEAYGERLSVAQIEAMQNATDTARIRLDINICGDPTNTRLEIINAE